MNESWLLVSPPAKYMCMFIGFNSLPVAASTVESSPSKIQKTVLSAQTVQFNNTSCPLNPIVGSGGERIPACVMKNQKYHSAFRQTC